jgi:hypothetical protein
MREQREGAELICVGEPNDAGDENSAGCKSSFGRADADWGRVRRAVVSDRTAALPCGTGTGRMATIVTHRPRVAKACSRLNRLTGQPDDAAFIAVFAPSTISLTRCDRW